MYPGDLWTRGDGFYWQERLLLAAEIERQTAPKGGAGGAMTGAAPPGVRIAKGKR